MISIILRLFKLSSPMSFLSRCHLFLHFEDLLTSGVSSASKMAESSGLGVTHCLKQLSDATFLNFKNLLIKEPELQVNPVLWANIKLASRTDLITLLNAHYPGQVWDIMSRTFLQVNRRDLWTEVQELRKGKRAWREKGHMGKLVT